MAAANIDWLVILLVFALFSYPIVGGLAFLVSSFYYRVFQEGREAPQYLQGGEPFVTVLIPAHNEEASIESTLVHLDTRLNYPDDRIEFVVVDDGSTDRTPEILERLQQTIPRLRVVTIVDNRGKAHGFNVAVAFARGEFILSNDADTRPNPDAIWQFLSYFEREGGKNIGAVTGNMLPANRTTLVAEAQQNELNSIIGLIKRSQLSYGALFAFSGANTMYRKSAVLDVGGWHAEQPTEDIAIAWSMQDAGWRAMFAPRIRFFLDVPEKLSPLVKQRQRWSSGGIYVLASQGFRLLRHPIRNYRMLPVLTDYTISIVWSFLYWIGMIVFAVTQAVFLLTGNMERFWHGWYMVGIFVAIEMVVGIAQLSVASIYNDRGRTLKFIVFAPWYLLVYWMVNTWTIVREFLPTIFKVWARRSGGVWKSPNRSESLQASTPARHGEES